MHRVEERDVRGCGREEGALPINGQKAADSSSTRARHKSERKVGGANFFGAMNRGNAMFGIASQVG